MCFLNQLTSVNNTASPNEAALRQTCARAQDNLSRPLYVHILHQFDVLQQMAYQGKCQTFPQALFTLQAPLLQAILSHLVSLECQIISSSSGSPETVKLIILFPVLVNTLILIRT